MFKYGITCCLYDIPETVPVVLRGPIEQVSREASEIGYNGLEIHVSDPRRYDWGAIRRICGAYGLEIAALSTSREPAESGLNLLSEDESVRRTTVKRIKEHIDCAQEAGAQVIVSSIRRNIPDESQREKYLNYHRDAIQEISGYAEEKGVRIWVENILAQISNFLNTAREVEDFVAGLGRENTGVHLDTYSMNMEDNDIAGSYRYCGKHLEYVHFSDTRRLYPGGGNVDFRAHMRSLKELDYKGFITVESVPQPTAYECAQKGYAYMKAMETITEIELGASRFR